VETPATFGRYEVIERVGRGGMGMLYRGKDPVLDREVAIKVMSGDFSADESARARFFREARAAARLQHRNIVTIFEFAEDEHGTPYIAMEFLRGRSLATRLTVEPPLSLVQKLDILTQLCTGLHYAHEQGIVHRDVKPANVWVMDDGTIKLLDFGIAKIAASTMTSSGNVLGSAAYMAPEQVSGREIDGRADVFAAGVVLYELLARRKPFEGDAPTAVMMKIIKDDPPPIRNFAPDIPVSLVNAVNKALQKDADKRFMHAGDFGSELRLIRLALERTSETLKAETLESSSDTVYVPTPTRIQAPPVATGGSGAPEAIAPGANLADANLQRGPAAAPAAVGNQFSTWVALAAVIVAAVLGTIVMMQRPSAPAAAGPTSAADRNPAVSTASATDGMVKLVSDPDGAAVTINGNPTGLMTPADIAVSDLKGAKVQLSKSGFRPHLVRAGETQIRSGVVQVRLDAAGTGGPVPPSPPEAPSAPAALSVTLKGSYPFEVLDGARVIGESGTEHTLAVAGPRVLRLRNSEYMLDYPVRVDATRTSASAPDLGRLTVRTPLETCNVWVAGRDLGYPPITDQKLAAGNYRVEVKCPDGNDRAESVTIEGGKLNTKVIR
jgi:eukaryotic-like serine/threonine-protein kinase